MISRALLTATSVVIALALGASMTWYSIRGTDQFGAVTIGGWIAFPDSGTTIADPYAKARLARDASLSLGAAEGVTFFAERDDTGALLSGSCSYQIVGASPTARIWTLVVLQPDQTPLNLDDVYWPTSLHSHSVFYDSTGGFSISIASKARPDNWLAVKDGETFMIAFTLYDSPVATNKGLIETSFPMLSKVACNA